MSLRDMLIEASQKYYTDGTSTMTDAEFDAGLKKLAEENPDDPIITAVGHGYEVDLDTTPGEKVKHQFYVGSLEKCYDYDSFMHAMKHVQDSVEALKYDGISVVLYYVHGALSRGVTRGKDNIGIDITSKVLAIRPEWSKIKDDFTGAVRGEILMRKSRFDDYVTTHSEAKNPRNTTAGLINGKYITEDDLKYLDIVLYTLMGGYGSIPQDTFHFYTSALSWLRSQFGEASVAKYKFYVPQPASEFCKHMTKVVEEFAEDFPYDGVVITNNILSYNLAAKNEVTYQSIAFKFEAESTETVVKGVEWNLSKTKYLIPRINVEPVELSGTTVQYATGYNADFIYKYKIKPGTKVTMLKSNEIIPIVTKVFDEQSNEWVNCSERYQ